jgi:uncharacterized membrane protein YhaH (DUF805 family)
MNLAYLFLSSKGRIGVSTFWLGVGALVIGYVAVFLVLWLIFGAFLRQNFLGRLIIFVLDLATTYFVYNLTAKRANDRGRPVICAQIAAGVFAVWYVTALVGITGNTSQNSLDEFFILAGTGVMLWYLIDLGYLGGTPGPNAHGENPEPP